VLALIEREPHGLPTLQRIVDELDVVPSALYRHFESRDDLMGAVFAFALGDLELEIPGDREWPERVREWMRAVYADLVRYPPLLHTMLDESGRTVSAWQVAITRLLGAMEGSGLGGERLALAALYVAESVVGLVMQQAPAPLSEYLAAARRGLARVSEPDRARLARLLSDASGLDSDALVEFAIDRTVASLRELAREPQRAGARRPRPQRRGR
jgi:AcrR family transcriptional regulator